MAALDLFGRRWSLRIIWELHQGPTGFRPLQQDNSSYTLTALGEDAYRALGPLARWAEGWADALAEQTTSHQAITEDEV
jgi:DNA-binding HxlR family transcriptional regulator